MEKKLTKGIKTRELILDKAREVFNEEGIFLTINEFSRKIGMTSGRITNHFPTKEHLFVGLSEQYEAEMAEVTAAHQYGPDLTFGKLAALFSKVMDVQYKHRSVILFFSVMHQSQSVMLEQLLKTWLNRQARLERLANTLVSLGLLNESILKPEEFAVFRFQYVNLFTTWMISYSLYDAKKSFKSIKPIYLKGIFRAFEDYLTEKGRMQFDSIEYK